MKFTFGIITTHGCEKGIDDLIVSIEKNKIPRSDYEIVVVGGDYINHFNGIDIRSFSFDETDAPEHLKGKWISRKKNIITENASFENIVYMLDYMILEDGWYDSMCEYGNNWDVLMTKVIDYSGDRFRDWCLRGSWKHNVFVEPDTLNSLVPYGERRLSKWMYINGSYWLAKREFMLKYPLDENLAWGDGEDVEWSYRITEATELQLNDLAVVKVNKPKPVFFSPARQEYLDEIYDIITMNDSMPLPAMKSNLTREKYIPTATDHGRSDD
tara:strand:+ start:36 stop:845 length:810 start_codon:yes stop_codon:yes gene_type:complete